MAPASAHPPLGVEEAVNVLLVVKLFWLSYRDAPALSLPSHSLPLQLLSRLIASSFILLDQTDCISSNSS